jgi:hypothetical protein
VAGGDARISFTIAVEGDPAMHRVQLRNGVMIISTANSVEAVHVAVTKTQLADFVLGAAPLPGGAPELTGFEKIYDRSQFLPQESLLAALGSKPLDHEY